MGIARGPAGAPASSFLRLRSPDEHRSFAFRRLISYLNKALDGVDLVFKEAQMPLGGMAAKNTGASTVLDTSGYHAIVEGMCARRGIAFEERHPSTIRKHFIGYGGGANRKETKRLVIQRCHQLGLLPKDCNDDDQADALSLHDYASAHFAGKPGAFKLFGDQ